MSEIRTTGYRVLTSLPTSGLFPGEIVVIWTASTQYTTGSTAVYVWDQVEQAWEAIPSLTDDLSITGTLDVSGNLTAGQFITAGGYYIGSDGTFNLANIRFPNATRLYSIEKAITATQIRKLAAAPVTLFTTTTGSYIVLQSAFLVYTHVANVYNSVGAGEDIGIRQTDGSGTQLVTAMDTSTDIDLGGAASGIHNFVVTAGVKPIVSGVVKLDNIGAGELASSDVDASGDGTIVVHLTYLEFTPV